MRGSGAIQVRLQLRGQAVERRPIGPPRAAGRHHAGAHLAHHLFQGFRVLSRLLEVQLVEHEARGLNLFVVAPDAVLVDQFPFRGSGRLRVRAHGQDRTGDQKPHHRALATFESSISLRIRAMILGRTSGGFPPR